MSKLPDVTPPKIYLEEWMAKIPGLDQKSLAERIETQPSTITKKFQKPGKIDLEWLERFRLAFERQDAADLFQHPDVVHGRDERLAELVRLWSDIPPARQETLLENARIFSESSFGKSPKR